MLILYAIFQLATIFAACAIARTIDGPNGRRRRKRNFLHDKKFDEYIHSRLDFVIGNDEKNKRRKWRQK